MKIREEYKSLKIITWAKWSGREELKDKQVWKAELKMYDNEVYVENSISF